ncbi:MAG: hypothetical protein H5T98_08590 [Syntrophomonadaceae bacterium]|nr:hypothetical protein [Syntrophomonadaceae bacterium]
MSAMFGTAAAGHGSLFSNPLIVFLAVVLSIFIFLKFCAWAKKFQLSRGVKKFIFIFTGLGLVVFNVLYSIGNKTIEAGGDWGMATTALLASLIWVFVFALALMSETKPE